MKNLLYGPLFFFLSTRSIYNTNSLICGKYYTTFHFFFLIFEMTWKFASVLISKEERMFCFDKNNVWKRSKTGGIKRNNLEIICCLPFWAESHQTGILSHKGFFKSSSPRITEFSRTFSNQVALSFAELYQFRVARQPGRASGPWPLAARGNRCLKEGHEVAAQGQTSQRNPQRALLWSFPSCVTKPGLLPPTPSLPTELQTAPAQSCRKHKVETTV